jgi:hypothetical protein
VTKPLSFEHVPIWKRELDDYSNSKKDVLKVLVGNKVRVFDGYATTV